MVATDNRPADWPRNGRPLTFTEFAKILYDIRDHHRWGESDARRSRWIKYIRPSFDMRDCKVFNVEFQGGHGTKTFDCRDSDEPMHERIMRWLRDVETAGGGGGE